VDVKNFVDQTWFDRAGNYHSDALHVVERYTPLTADVISTRRRSRTRTSSRAAWKMRMPLYRRVERTRSSWNTSASSSPRN
jgi:hypothetical protein